MKTINQKPILVTEASSGIGNHITKYLAERGYLVYGTGRNESDLEELKMIKNVIPILLDVRRQDHIRDALGFIVEEGKGLYGLINNAGIGELGMHSVWTDNELQNIFDVNVFGPHRMTNTFVRLLIAAQGRIVNIGSQGGMITKKYYGPYTMTKHALDANTVSLDQELEPYGVRVSIVQPGGIITNVDENSMPGTLARFQRAKPPFKEEAEQILTNLSQPAQSSEDDEESDANR